MYLVLLAGSLPGLRPLFNKRVKKPINHNSIYGYSSRQSRKSSKHDLVVRLSNLPSSQSKAYATISNNNNRTHSDSTENFFKNINSGQIIKTTEVNVSSGRSSIGRPITSPWGNESTDAGRQEIERAQPSV